MFEFPAQATFVSVEDFLEYASHQAWRCDYRTRYGKCMCGLDDLCDELGIERIPPNDPEAS